MMTFHIPINLLLKIIKCKNRYRTAFCTQTVIGDSSAVIRKHWTWVDL